MRTLPIDASDEAIKSIVVEWSELLADKRFEEALALCPPSAEMNWTPEQLQAVIAGYGAVEDDLEALARLHKRHGVERFEITTLLGRPDHQDIIDRKIDVNREDLFGMDPALYLGMVHYDDVPLSGSRSDLTARFNIRRVGADQLALEFEDLHVM